jgi:hypothetical protein
MAGEAAKLQTFRVEDFMPNTFRESFGQRAAIAAFLVFSMSTGAQTPHAAPATRKSQNVAFSHLGAAIDLIRADVDAIRWETDLVGDAQDRA